MRVTGMFLAAGILGLLATAALAASVPPDGFSGFWSVDSGPGNSWIGQVWYYSSVQAMPTDYNVRIVPLPVANAPADSYLGKSQYFETNPPHAATVEQYGSHTGPLATTETQFGPYEMEIHAPAHDSLGTPGDCISLPFALGDWQGWGVDGSPSFVLQLQAYDADGKQVGNASISYDGVNHNWDGVSHYNRDGYPRSADFYKDTLGVGAWQVSKPLPEPLTILGVFGAVAGIGAYIRKRSVA
jgi:hypothetical protein